LALPKTRPTLFEKIPGGISELCGKNKTTTMLLEQLFFFGFAFTRPENAFQKEKVAISGKSSGGKDDLCMALLIGLFFVVEDRFILR